jgi:hypothetical protein
MKKIIISLFLLLSTTTFCQVLTGKIKDSQGIEIPFVTIRIENTSYGTVSNAGGNYQLEVKKGKQVIKYSREGYESVIDTFEIVNQTTIHDLVLNELTNQIDEVVVIPTSAKERGKEIMKQVIEKRSYFQELLATYTCDTYCFSSLEKEKRDSLIKELVIGKEKLNIIEWRAKTSYEATTHFKDEFYAFNDFADPSNESNLFEAPNDGAFGDETVNLAPQSKVNSNPYLFINGIKDAHFSILDNTIVSPKLTQNPIISPLAFNAFVYYNFYLEKTYFDSLNQMVYEIKVKPKFEYEALFSGSLFIKDNSWEIISYDFSINPKALLFFQDIHIICDYQKSGEYLIPVRKEFVYTIKEDKTLINGMIRVSHTDYTFDLSKKSNKFWLETATYTNDAFDKDSSYWNEKRPFSLKDFEKNFMHEQDSIIRYHETDEYFRSSDSIRNKFNLLSTIFSGFSHVNSFKKYEFTTIPLIAQVNPFGVGGFRYRFGVSYQKEFLNGKKLYVEPLFDYGFLNKDLKGSFGGAILYNPLNFSKLGFKIGDTYDYIGGTQNILNVFIPKNRIRNQKIELTFSRELLNGLYLKNSLLYSDRRTIDNIKFPGWVNDYDTINPQQIFSFARYKVMLLTFEFEYHIQSKYMIRKGKKIVYGSPWPTFYFTYKKGLPSVFNSNSNFDYAQFKIQDDINLRAFGTSKFLLESGMYLQKKDLRDIEYKYFRPSDYNFFSNPINSLQLLDTSLRTPNNYLQINFIHHFNGFFLNKIWGINKLKLEESVGGSFLTIPVSNFTQAEFYVGVERRLHVKQQLFKIGFYFVTSDNNLGNANYHFKIGINSFNNFTNKWDY